MIKNCKQHVLRKGKLWDQDIPTLVESLSLAIRLNDMYQEQYKMTKESLASQPKSKQLEIDEVKTFGKFDLFCRRASKLVDLFTTIEQVKHEASHKAKILIVIEMIIIFAQACFSFRHSPDILTSRA